jgi:hypothetical protein
MKKSGKVKRRVVLSNPRVKPAAYSDEMIDRIHRLWQSGKHTVQEIANDLCVTKNTISGIIHRHRRVEGEMAWRVAPRGRAAPLAALRPTADIPEVTEDSTVVKSPKKRKRPPIWGQRQPGKPVAPSMPDSEIIGTTIRWIDRTAFQCAYIEDDPKEAGDIKHLQCCGRPVTYMGVWCEYHRGRIYSVKPIKGLDRDRRFAVTAMTLDHDHGGHRDT